MPQFDWPPKSLPSLDAALRDVKSQKGSFRRNAAIALGKAPPERADEAIGALDTLLDDDERDVRIEAIYAAANLLAESLSERILATLTHADPDVRIAVIEYAASMGSNSASEQIARLVTEDDDVPVCCMALEALPALDADLALTTTRTIIRDGSDHIPLLRTALVLIRALGEEADIEEIARHLDDRRPGVTLEAAASLAHFEDGRGRARLTEEATNPAREEERFVALESLCRIADDSTLEVARKRFSALLARKEEKIFWAGMLASSGDAHALEKLGAFIGGNDPMRAALAMRAAGFCSIDALVLKLSSIARQDPDLVPVTECIEALGSMRTTVAEEALSSIAEKSGNEQTAQHARAALQEVRRWIGS